MNLQKKLEEIRSKPEHVRERYLWIAMAISTVIVISVWIFSIRMSVKDSGGNENDAKLKESVQQAKDDIQDAANENQVK